MNKLDRHLLIQRIMEDTIFYLKGDANTETSVRILYKDGSVQAEVLTSGVWVTTNVALTTGDVTNYFNSVIVPQIDSHVASKLSEITQHATDEIARFGQETDLDARDYFLKTVIQWETNNHDHS